VDAGELSTGGGMKVTITVESEGDGIAIDEAPSLTLAPTNPYLRPAAKHRRATPDWIEALDFGLTDREVDVLRLLATGMQYKQIAIKLGMAERTVRSHMTNIFQRTGTQSNTMLLSYAWLAGIVTESDVLDAWREIAPHLVQVA